MNKGYLFICLFLFLGCGKNEIKVEKVLEKNDTLSKTQASGKVAEKKQRIKPVEAQANIGNHVTVYGLVADVVIRDKVSYLNFDFKYPKNTFTAVIFASDYNKFEDLKSYKNDYVEVKGTVMEYRGKPQIILNSPDQIKVIE